MNLEILKNSDRIIFEVIGGSHAYGTNTPTSDKDIRGFYINPPSEYATLSEPAGQISDNKQDITYYSLKRAFELLITANPNMIELLWMPEDCIQIKKPAMDILIANRDLFISKKCFHTHSGYAYAQIDKAKGSNKKVHNPQPAERPKKEDFCWIILDSRLINTDILLNFSRDVRHTICYTPSRPIPIKNLSVPLSQFHCARLEQCSHVYRLYHYGEEAKGVFRGDDMLVCESIPIDDEVKKFWGLLIYNQDLYEKAIRDWHSYWDWMKNRNEARWIDQEKGKLNYDQKNMMHCMRLLISGENILRHGFPIVRFDGEQKEYLMKIRSGDYQYDELMAEVETRMATLKELYDTSAIPHSVNMSKIEDLYQKISNFSY